MVAWVHVRLVRSMQGWYVLSGLLKGSMRDEAEEVAPHELRDDPRFLVLRLLGGRGAGGEEVAAADQGGLYVAGVRACGRAV